jgi:hypothetical protein
MNEEESQRYLEAASREPLLSREEERDLAQSAIQGFEGARERLLRAHMRLVVSVAHRLGDLGSLTSEDIGDLFVLMARAPSKRLPGQDQRHPVDGGGVCLL